MDRTTEEVAVIESNFCTASSRVAATIRATPSGGSRIHVDWRRTPTSFSGRLGMLMVTGTRGAPIRRRSAAR
jgi:hypothetical protein